VKMKEWIEQLPLISQVSWSRQRAAAAIDELAPGVAPIVFGSSILPTETQQEYVTTLWAALPLGLAIVTVTTPLAPDESTISLVVDAWPAVASTLRLDSAGTTEERLPMTLTAATQRIESTKQNRDELLTLFRECVARIGARG
jgi:hypothetical protein